MPASGHRVKSLSLEKTIRPMRCPAGMTWSSGCRSKVQVTNPPGVRGSLLVIEAWFWGSIHPRVMTLLVMGTRRPVVHGRETSHTERLAASASAATRRVTLGSPDRCTGSSSSGVT